MAVQVEDKIKLMEELGLKEAAQVVRFAKIEEERKVEMEKEAKALSSMKFKPITKEQIRAKLPKWHWERPSVEHIFGWRRVKIVTLSLLEWHRNLPYGALLAIKEAKEAGIQNFGIAFPVDKEREDIRRLRILQRIEAEKRAEMLRKDPVIYGYTKSGLMVEVFAWDDSTIHNLED